MRRRLVLLYLALVLIVAAWLSWSAYRSTTALYRQEVEQRLLDNAAWLGDVLFTGSDGNPDGASMDPNQSVPGAFDEVAVLYAERMAMAHTGKYEQGKLRITIIRKDGVVVGDSETDSRLMENHATRPEVVAAYQVGNGSDERVSASIGTSFLYHARWFPEPGVFIRLALPLDALRTITYGILRTALLGVFVSLVLTGVLARMFSRVVTAPVLRLSRQLSTLDAQHASLRLQAPGDREMGTLTRNVNELADRLEESVLALGDRNAKVDTIINSLQTGLVAVDPDMRLIMVNPVIFGLFGLREQADVLGRPILEVFRNQALVGMLESAVFSEKSERREITLFDDGKRVLEVHACPIRPMEGATESMGALAHVADVTAVRRLEEIRSQFVSNVTHELKTPLTSIRGFVETLRNGALRDEAIAARFLEIIDIEVDRLSGLIDDILSLSEIEGMKTEAPRERFPLAPLVDEVLQLLAATASESGIQLDADIPEGLCLYANRNRIKQLMLNLVENGVKYNRKGGKVTVGAKAQPGSRTQIQVTDTGIGIPEEFQERVFERFYRVDRGRSRAQGGTGLGLSIVKHIAQLYGGTVELKSDPGKGSTFLVTLQDGEQRRNHET